MAFIHILPESVELFYDSMTGAEDAHDHRLRMLQITTTNKTAVATPEEEKIIDRHGIFPLPYLLFFVGYCLVLLVDRVLAGEYGHSHAHGNDDHQSNAGHVDEKGQTN